ncbi:hypothetical protein [Salisediminibacterium halotolerans]|uniref:Uncharacterized protein n=1 Tax=Salisediminibacterium halotolerans TaxID=517425 RepID=A0A1H9R544_9BACI|nr:hypothetical protein [Salisediminibacterium haloalkalitolerans]SER67727.1 hypothetical protein SAMN05444126_10429 [Salisediminibacterium haloalkalitolerans]
MKRFFILAILVVVLSFMTAYSLIEFRAVEGDSDTPAHMPVSKFQSAETFDQDDLTADEAKTIGRSLTADYLQAAFPADGKSSAEKEHLFADPLYRERSIEDFRSGNPALQNIRLDFLKEQTSSFSHDSFTYRSEFSLIASPQEAEGRIENSFILIADLIREDGRFLFDYINVEELPEDD